MRCLPGYGTWIMAKRHSWSDSPPFGSLTVDFDKRTGEVKAGLNPDGSRDTVHARRENELTTAALSKITPTSPTKFGAVYAIGKYKGTFEAEIDNHRCLEISLMGTVTMAAWAEPIRTTAPQIIVDPLTARGASLDS